MACVPGYNAFVEALRMIRQAASDVVTSAVKRSKSQPEWLGVGMLHGKRTLGGVTGNCVPELCSFPKTCCTCGPITRWCIAGHWLRHPRPDTSLSLTGPPHRHRQPYEGLARARRSVVSVQPTTAFLSLFRHPRGRDELRWANTRFPGPERAHTTTAICIRLREGMDRRCR
jgi:hypothetical protein